MPSPCSANDRWFQVICAAGEPEGARPASDKIFASPSGDASLHPSQTLPYGACPPIPFLKKRINIPRVEYISTTKIRANRPQPYRQNSRQKIGTRSEIFSTHFFKKKEGNAQQCRIRVLQPEMAQGAPAANIDFMWKRRDPCALSERKTRGRRGAVHRPARPAEHAVHRPPDARAAVRDAHMLPARRGPHHALKIVPPPEAQDAGVPAPGGRPLPHAPDAHARGRAPRAHDRPRARTQRGPHRGHQPRARPRPHAVRPRGGARAQRDLHRRRLPAL